MGQLDEQIEVNRALALENRALKKQVPKYITPLVASGLRAGATLEAGMMHGTIAHYFGETTADIVTTVIGATATTAGVFVEKPDARATLLAIGDAHAGPGLFKAGQGLAKLALGGISKFLDDGATGT